METPAMGVFFISQKLMKRYQPQGKPWTLFSASRGELTQSSSSAGALAEAD
jgi:hypothetical protein